MAREFSRENSREEKKKHREKAGTCGKTPQGAWGSSLENVLFASCSST